MSSLRTNADAASASPLSTLVRNSAFNVVGSGIVVSCNLVAMLVLARRLGPSAMGVFFTLFAVCAVINWIADAGITTVLTRRVARFPEQLRSLVGESMGLLPLVVAVSASLFLMVSSGWMYLSTGSPPWGLLVAAAGAMAARHAMDFAANIYRGLERFEFENLARVLQAATFCAIVCQFVQAGDISTAFFAYAASNLLGAGVIWLLLLVRVGFPVPRLGPKTAWAWVREGAPLGVGDVIRHLLLQLDTLMLAAMRPAAAVGLFSVAARPLQPLQLVPRTIVSVTFPMMSRSGHTDRAQLSRMFASSTNLLWVAALPISIATGFCAKPLILATAGPEFVAAAGPLRLLIWASVLLFVNAQFRFVLTAIDAERAYSGLIARALVAKAIVNLALIPLLGVYGACLGNLLGEACLCAWGLSWLAAEQIRGPSVPQLLRVVPAGILMAATMMLFGGADAPLWKLLLGAVVATVVYLSAVLLFGALPREQVARFWRVIRPDEAAESAMKATSTISS